MTNVGYTYDRQTMPTQYMPMPTQYMPTQSSGRSPLKIIFLFAMMGVTSYFLIKLSKSLVTELEDGD